MSPPPPPPPRRSKPASALVIERESMETSGISKRASVPPPKPVGTPLRSSDAAEPLPRATPDPGDFEHSVHLDAQGNILAGNGQLEELASLAAYACRIGSLVGRQLSFGDVAGIEVTLATGVIMLHRDAAGEIVSVKPRPQVNLVQLRAQLNL